MDKKIVIFGGSFNPPGMHHIALVKKLVEEGFYVIILPCGKRPDKLSVGTVTPIHRAIMITKAFRDIPNTEIDFFDLENEIFTPTWQLEEKYCHRGEIHYFVGADQAIGGAKNEAKIQHWVEGAHLWSQRNFVIGTRDGYPLTNKDMPPRSLLINTKSSGSSQEIRNKVFNRQPITGLVSKEVEKHIERYGLYFGSEVGIETFLDVDIDRIKYLGDKDNPRACELLNSLKSYEGKFPDMYGVISGDGGLLHAVRTFWPKRVPFFGINAGHRGFHLNDVLAGFSPKVLAQTLKSYLLPLLEVEYENHKGEVKTCFAFNEAWLRTIDGSVAAWLKVTINKEVQLSKLASDGILISTAIGSTAYARSMGGTPVPINKQDLVLVGNNVYEPHWWKHSQLSVDSTVEFEDIGNTKKRGVEGFADGKKLGKVHKMKVRVSRTAAVELVFLPEFDPARKLIDHQFPGRDKE